MKTMRRFSILFGLIIYTTPFAEAGGRTFAWTKDERATSYVLQQSQDNGATWSEVWRGGDPPATITTTVDERALYRICSTFGLEIICRLDAGVWVDESQKSGPVGLVTP